MTITITQVPSSNSIVIKQLDSAAYLMDSLLEFHTGLHPLDRKILTYCALGTHTLPHSRLYPLAVLRGPQGTGKTTAMKIAKLFAYQPTSLSARGCTLPVLRDKLAEAHEGTVFIEEGDAAWKKSLGFEDLLSDRYHRDSAEQGYKVPTGDGGYEIKESKYFGATFVHRRTPFADSALEGRSVVVQFRAVHGRTYEPIGNGWDAEWNDSPDVKAIQELTFELPSIEKPQHIAARVWDSYSPVVAVARMLGDSEFEKEIMQRIDLATMTLKDAQATAELHPIVVRALIQLVPTKQGELICGQGVALKEIRETVWENERTSVTPLQIGAILMELGFEKRKSHGVTKVYPSPTTLVRACSELGIEDEAIDKLRTDLQEKLG